ncbi:hypothetical protein SAY87_019746 [Trapa incisa]|uniref:Uncharacterized protein n=1 Tax=Trapa incisa TaxID=236973 RepID=A0AAN7K0B5_9MYRT|nr:hypothetical protein SAY87_019746 [Trapa incisa]
MYDTESVLRIFSTFLNIDEDDGDDEDGRMITTVPALQDRQLPEAVPRSMQPRGTERATSGPDGDSGALLRAGPHENALNTTTSHGGGGIHCTSNGHSFFSQFPHRSGSGAGSGAISPRDNYASVRRENRELRLEVTRMRMRLTDLERDHVTMKEEMERPHPVNRLMRSLTRKLNSIFQRSRSMNKTLPPVAPPKAGSDNGFSFRKCQNLSIS